MAGDSLLERLFSNKSKYPPDVKFITLGGPLPAHKSLLTSTSPGMKEYFFPKVGPPRKGNTIPFMGGKEAATLYRDYAYGLDISMKVKFLGRPS